MFERGYSFSVRAVDYLILFGQKPIPKLSSRLTGLLDHVTQVIGIRGLNIGASEVGLESVLVLFLAPDRFFGEAV